METIRFVNELKHTLWTIKTVGGNPGVHVTPDHELLNKLRELIFKEANGQEIRVARDGWRYSSFFKDVSSTDRFEKRIQYCIIKLREFGISENDYFTHISQALDVIFFKGSDHPSLRSSNTSFQILFVEELAKCFEILYYPSEVQYYDLAIDHQLVYFDYLLQRWSLSSLGEYVLNLPVFEVIVFLCAVEVILGRRRAGNRYLNSQILERLQGSKPKETTLPIRHERIPSSLRLFGIVDTDSEAEELVITDLGRRVLTKVSSKLKSLRDTILLLTEAEAGGLRFSENTDLINQIKTQTKQSPNLVQDQKSSIESAVSLFAAERYLDSLRLFYPNIEAVLNSSLKKKGFRPEDFKGMRDKIQRLEQEQVLTARLGTWTEIVTSRNKIVHGNLFQEDAELVKPLFYFIGTFWMLLISEIDNHFSTNTP
ncbi:hypothetical protein ACQ4M3_38750 [Leptolyngbya sp. AN03gr2]|uniref:hypothetical protein n=1 Tax=unclassified Leptolyngbya TaxID=2650499 RepID=UPI003D3111ED